MTDHINNTEDFEPDFKSIQEFDEYFAEFDTPQWRMTHEMISTVKQQITNSVYAEYRKIVTEELGESALDDMENPRHKELAKIRNKIIDAAEKALIDLHKLEF